MIPVLAFVQHYKKFYTSQFESAAVRHGLNQLEIDILLFLHNNPDCRTASDICRYRGLAKSNVSKAVEHLRTMGLLTVSPAADNRRQRMLGFTDAAAPLVQELHAIQQAATAAVTADLTPAEAQAMQDYMARMDATLCRRLAEKRRNTMTYLVAFIVCFIAGIGAGLGTGFAGMSAAAVISPILITFLGMDPYMAVGIALASDVLASAVSAYTYKKNGNLDVKNGAVMMAAVLVFTMVGSFVASKVPGATMGSFSVFMTMLLGVKFIVRPVMTTKEAMQGVSAQKRLVQSLVCGMGVGFICGFIGAGGGMMMLLLLTSVLGYELKTAVGTSVFIMTFTALTGAVSHFAIGGAPDLFCLVCCVLSTLLWARIAAKFANKAEPTTLNRATGVVLVILGVVILGVKYL